MFHCYDLGISGRVHDSPTQLFLSLETPGCLKKQRTHPNPFSKQTHYCGNLKIKKIENLENVEKTGTGKSRMPVLKTPENPEYGTNIVQQNMKWTFDNMGSLSSKNILNDF